MTHGLELAPLTPSFTCGQMGACVGQCKRRSFENECSTSSTPPDAEERPAASCHRRRWTHLEELALLSTLTAEVSENTVLVLQKVPRRPKLNDSAVIKDKDPGFRVSRLFCRGLGCSARPRAII